MNDISRLDAMNVASGAVGMFALTYSGDKRFHEVLHILYKMIREEEANEEHQW